MIIYLIALKNLGWTSMGTPPRAGFGGGGVGKTQAHVIVRLRFLESLATVAAQVARSLLLRHGNARLRLWVRIPILTGRKAVRIGILTHSRN